MKQTEVFYFDVDGTILDNTTMLIGKDTIQALRALKDKGYKLAVCTGRTAGGVLNTEIDELVDWDLYVLANGSMILDKDHQLIKAIHCDPKFIKQLIALYKGPILLEGDTLYSTDVLSEHMKNFLKSGNLAIPPVIEYSDELIQKVILEDLNLIEGGIDHPIFKEYQYNINTSNLYEIFPKIGGKHTGIEIGNEYFKTSRSTFFGDGTNDLSALKYATVGVAMGNASDLVKDAADLVTASVSEDGIAKILKDYDVI